MIVRGLLSVGVLVFVHLNRIFLVDVLFEDEFKRFLNVLDRDIESVKNMRMKVIQLVPLCILLPKSLALLYGVVLTYLYFKPYLATKREMKLFQAQLHYEFPIWIRSIQCHLQSSTVVVAIEKSYEYAPQLLKHYLKDLIWKLSCEPHKLEHYEQFMSMYENYEIEKMMKFLYRFNYMDTQQGEKHLDRMIESTGQWMNQTRLQKQEDKVNQYSIYGVLPVAVVSIYFLIIMSLVIVAMMEGGWML